jgi:hypothetical protein
MVWLRERIPDTKDNDWIMISLPITSKKAKPCDYLSTTMGKV